MWEYIFLSNGSKRSVNVPLNISMTNYNHSVIMDRSLEVRRRESHEFGKLRQWTSRFWAQNTTRAAARNVINSFEDVIRGKIRQQIAGASVAIALTPITFLYSLYIRNYLIALIRLLYILLFFLLKCSTLMLHFFHWLKMLGFPQKGH